MQRSLIALAALVVGCANEPAAPAPHVGQLEGVLAAKGGPKDASAVVVIDDVLERLLPALDAQLAGELKGPLTAIKAALKSKDLAALAGATAIANAVLEAPIAANDEYAPDLAAIVLALDAAAAK